MVGLLGAQLRPIESEGQDASSIQAAPGKVGKKDPMSELLHWAGNSQCLDDSAGLNLEANRSMKHARSSGDRAQRSGNSEEFDGRVQGHVKRAC